MGENSTLRNNEKEANVIVAKVMRISFFIFILVYILNLMNIFIVEDNIMTIAFVSGSICLLLPTLLTNILKMESAYLKYLYVICAAVFVMILSTTLTYHVVVIYVYPIGIASLYFSKHLNIVATILTVIGVSVGQLLAFFWKTLQDDNFMDINSVIVFGIIPRALVLIAVAAIFTMLTSRTASMLSSLMGAEEQKEILEHMNRMKENATETSEILFDTVNKLTQITDSSLQANQSIAEETERLLQGSLENTEAIETINERMDKITQQLTGLTDMNHTTAHLTKEIGQNIQENQSRLTAYTIFRIAGHQMHNQKRTRNHLQCRQTPCKNKHITGGSKGQFLHFGNRHQHRQQKRKRQGQMISLLGGCLFLRLRALEYGQYLHRNGGYHQRGYTKCKDRTLVNITTNGLHQQRLRIHVTIHVRGNVNTVQGQTLAHQINQ